ncbi:conserved hypothetical protein [Aspergillus terreus NIH2624]|jgi:hypothetical protein|uniref:Uncharacterized protein n=1 Tax=Aspergillus terreus (strain NIH 2624 / FGSC A1156) TaxID=341663 RepID=Q0CH63_ASPTN|nr:uncharacterized protein ATEG_06979 [Aspergillus terreus NIH2624]EAU32363.1 conserved hypothetical protein [Aspergillus terreus NIH2624]
MKTAILLHAIGLAALPLANAIPLSSLHHGSIAQQVNISAQQIEAIAPSSKSCANVQVPDECATAQQAAPNIAKAFQTYKITSPAEQAAVIGLIAFESVEFRYNKNKSPGVPGQGTRNMQSPAFNKKYAESIPALAEKLAPVADKPAEVLNLLLADERYDFASGAWFLTTQCTDAVRKQLQSGSEAGWRQYITDCVGTEANEDRKAYWQRAVQALGVKTA